MQAGPSDDLPVLLCPALRFGLGAPGFGVPLERASANGVYAFAVASVTGVLPLFSKGGSTPCTTGFPGSTAANSPPDSLFCTAGFVGSTALFISLSERQ